MSEMTSAKAIVAAIGTTATAVATAAATAQVVLADNKLDIGEYSTIAGALATLVLAVYGVWKTPNKPKTADQSEETWATDWRG